MRSTFIHTLNKISIVLIFLSLLVLSVHYVYTIDLKRRQQNLNRELGKFMLSLIDERVDVLPRTDGFDIVDIVISISDSFDIEHTAEILVFDSITGKTLYPAGVLENFIRTEFIEKTKENIEGTFEFGDRFGYYVRYDKLDATFLFYTEKSDLFLLRNQLLYMVIVIMVVFSLVFIFIDLRIKNQLRVFLNKMKVSFERAFINKSQLLQPIQPLGRKEIDAVLDSYNSMALKASNAFKSLNGKLKTLIQQRDNLKKIISLYKKYSQSETVMKIDEDNVSDFVSKRQYVSSLSIEILNFLEPVDEVYPEIITGELNNFNNYLKSEVMSNGGMINFSNGYFINIIYGAPTPFEFSFLHAVRGSKKVLQWIEDRNNSERNISGVKWEVKMGLSYGYSVTGTVGESFMVLSGAVEESFKMLDYAKYYGVSLVTDSLAQLESLDEFRYRKLDYVGDPEQRQDFDKEKLIYEIFLEMPQKLDDAIKLYYHGLEMFIEGKYDMAIYEFKKVNEIFGGDNPSKIFLKRCEEYIKA